MDRAAFRLGQIAVRPSTRALEGPSGVVAVEPRIMQVLLELVDAQGAVVGRNELLRRCWSGVIVGDDALNRAIFELRRALVSVGSELAVETIPKTGYRLAGLPMLETAVGASEAPRPRRLRPPALSRRALLAGATAGGAMLVGGIALWRRPSEAMRQAAALVERGDIVRRDDMPDASEQGVGFYREALKLAPDDAATWGKMALALALVAEYATPAATAKAVHETQMAARHALDLQPGQPDARVALLRLAPHFGLWSAYEQGLRAVLADAPDNDAAQADLALLLMEVGRVDDAAALTDKLAQGEPLSPVFQYRHVYQLWARGRLAEADQVADRALQLWPRHPSVWLSRFWTFALTGRVPAARAMVEDSASRPEFPPATIRILQLSGRALATRASADIAAAIEANVAGARVGQFGVVSATLTLPLLGATDVAYDVNRGYLVRQGDLVGSLRRPADQPAINEQNRRKTMMLWMPSVAPLRADPRFMDLCRTIGLTDYWQRSGHGPDYLSRRPG